MTTPTTPLCEKCGNRKEPGHVCRPSSAEITRLAEKIRTDHLNDPRFAGFKR